MTLRYSVGDYECYECGSTQLEYGQASGVLRGSFFPSGCLFPRALGLLGLCAGLVDVFFFLETHAAAGQSFLVR